MKPQIQVVQSIQRLACSKCGAETNAACNCGAIYEAIAERAEAHRQSNREHARRKREQKQRAVDIHQPQVDTIEELIESPDSDSLVAKRVKSAEERCAAKWKAFTAQEERNAVSNILEAIRDLTDEQRALLFQTLKESYQWQLV